MRKNTAIFLTLCILLFSLSGCGKESGSNNNDTQNQLSEIKTVTDISTDTMDIEFTNNDRDSGYNGAAETDPNTDIITVTDGGKYIVEGSHSQIVVDAGDSDKPQIILKNAQINCSDGPAIYVKQADKVFITIPEDTESSLSDGESYNSGYDNADGAIFSKADLTINGGGKLNITGAYKCGIVSKDDLVIYGTQISVKSTGAAIEGKDCVKLSGATLKIEAGGDGIKSTNTEEANLGFVYIESGNYTIEASNDGIQAETALMVTGGSFNITTGGGSAVSSSNSNDNGWGMWGRPDSSNSASTDTPSAKALKCSTLIKIDGGEFTIDSSDDSVHSNSDIEINGGSFTAASGDDGIHADDQLLINSGDITVTKSYEGIEATAITVSGGNLDVTANDDGFNAAGGSDSSGLGGRPGQNTFESNSDAQIVINGGYILVNASGDGVDSNGDININGGVLLVSGPTDSGNGALDMGGNAYINGGTAVFAGSSGMAEVFSENSKQPSVAYALSNTVSGGTSIAAGDKSGNVLASFLPSKNYNHIIISCPDFEKGEEYTLSIGGSVTNCDKNGYTRDGKVTDTSESLDIELSSMSTSYGTSGMGGGMGGGGFGGGGFGGGMGGKRY